MAAKTCLTQNTKVTNDKGSTSFMCPGCGEYEIVRSTTARVNAIKYKCPKCGFEGPN